MIQDWVENNQTEKKKKGREKKKKGSVCKEPDVQMFVKIQKMVTLSIGKD